MIRHLQRAAIALALATAAGPLVLSPPAVAAAADARCAVPDSLTFVDTPLPHLAKRLATQQTVHVVILGTSSSMPLTRGLPRSYAAGLQAALEARLPGTRLQIDNLSEKTQTAMQMAVRIAGQIVPMKPDLVLWQTGNVDAAQQIDVNDVSAALEQGLGALRDAGIDAMLIAPQFRMRLSVMVDVAPYNRVMSQIASAEAVGIFPRFEIMRYWAETGAFDSRDADSATQIQLAEAQNRCLAGLLADMIARAARLPPP